MQTQALGLAPLPFLANNPAGQQTQKLGFPAHTFTMSGCTEQEKISNKQASNYKEPFNSYFTLVLQSTQHLLLSGATETNKENMCQGSAVIIYDLFSVSDYAPFTAARVKASSYAASSFSTEVWCQLSSLRAACDGSWLLQLHFELLVALMSLTQDQRPPIHRVARTTADSPRPRAWDTNEEKRDESPAVTDTRDVHCVLNRRVSLTYYSLDKVLISKKNPKPQFLSMRSCFYLMQFAFTLN